MPWGAIASAIGSVVGGIQTRNAVQNAAQAQEKQTQKALDLEQQNQQAGVNFQTGEWNQQQANEQPFLSEGQTSANSLSKLLQQGFTAPTQEQAEQTPGYQFNLQSGTQAINENAAATGNLMSGNTGVALQKYGQGLATTTYQQAYNNALNQYQTNYQSLLGGTQVGETAAGQLGSEGQAAANNLSNLYLTGGQQQAQQLNNIGSEQAASDIGSANAWNTMIGQLQNTWGGGGTSVSSYCWIAAAVYGGWDDPRTVAVRQWLTEEFSKKLYGKIVIAAYRTLGREVAWCVKRNALLKRFFRALFDVALRKSGFRESTEKA
jgi:hypothetical protein